MDVKKVVIFGGGIGGLSAAHELTEGDRAQHFSVEVIERDDVLGGKAQSYKVDGDPAHQNRYPGEHGFRFFPTFYRHIVDTMARIPSKHPTLGRVTVKDHLRPTPTRMVARYDKKPLIMPSAPKLIDPRVLIEIVKFLIDAFDIATELPPLEGLHFARRLVQIATSSKARKLARYERQSWWDFIDAESKSDTYRRYLADGLTRTLVAADPHQVNAKTGGDVLVRILIDSNIPGFGASADRVLDGPTSDVWIEPWRAMLADQGRARFHRGTLESLTLAPGRDAIASATVRKPDGSTATVQADYYVAAIPVEEMALVLDRSPGVADAGERLNGIVRTLRHDVRSMTGLQFYLDRPLDVPSDLGHALYVDTEWAITSITQSHFWREPFDAVQQWGGGNIRTVWSTIASDWDRPCPASGGISADHCTRAQLRDLALQQLGRSLNGDRRRFDPSSVVAWNLDAAVTPGGNGQTAKNTMKLLINQPDRWQHRPDAAPAGLGNLLLASDYVRSNTDLATMEAANEAARRAVNAILEREGSAAHRCAIFDLYYPDAIRPVSELIALWTKLDEDRFRAGEDWKMPFDVDLPFDIDLPSRSDLLQFFKR